MSANTIITSIVTGGTNTHTTTAEEANALATDFVSNGVVGTITLNTGSAGTGSFCVNATGTPDMTVTIKAGQAYVTATPSSQNSQVLRIRAAADYTAYTINSNSSGSTKYDWIYLSVDATQANNPASDASDVTSIVTSRSSSNSTDNGSPPTYGLLLAVITVANGASSITNSNISDKRYNASLGAQAGSLVVQQNGTGTDAQIAAAGIDANVNVTAVLKGTGTFKTSPVNRIDQSALPLGAVVQVVGTSSTAVATGTTTIPADDTIPQSTEGTQFMTQAITPKATTNILVIEVVALLATHTVNNSIGALYQDSTANALAASTTRHSAVDGPAVLTIKHTMTAGTTSATTFKFRAGPQSADTLTFNGSNGSRLFGAITKSSITITEYKA